MLDMKQLWQRLLVRSDGWLLGLAAALVLPVYLVVSVGYGLSANGRLGAGLAKLPPAMVDGLPENATQRWSAGQLIAPRVDDSIRAARANLQRNLDSRGGQATVEGEQAVAVRAAMRELRVGVTARFLGYEQLICLVLTAWTVLMIARRWQDVSGAQRRLAEKPVELKPGEVVTPKDAKRLQAALLTFEDQQGESGLSRTIYRCLKRFETAQDVAAAEAVVQSQSSVLADEMDSGLSLARYAAWAVPSIGFIGTVRGIGAALSLADSPNNLPDIVGYLAVAFDTTLIALLLSIVMMLVVHLFQKVFESYSLNLAKTCERLVLSHLHVPLHEPIAAARDEVRGEAVAARAGA